jgi:hypothetical protein
MACPLTWLKKLAERGYKDRFVDGLRSAVVSARQWDQYPDHAEKFKSLQTLARQILFNSNLTPAQADKIQSCVTLLQRKWDAESPVQTIFLVRGYLEESEKTIWEDLEKEGIAIQQYCSDQDLKFATQDAMTVERFCNLLKNSRPETAIVYTGHGSNEGILLTNADGTSGDFVSIGSIKAALAQGQGVLYLNCCQAAMMLALDPEDPDPLGNLVGAIFTSAASDDTTGRSVKEDVKRIWDLVDQHEHAQANDLYVDHLSALLFRSGYFRPLFNHRIFPLTVDTQISGTEYGFAAIMQKVGELRDQSEQTPVETFPSSGTSSTTEDAFDSDSD